jgi:TolB-like protein
LVDTAGDGILAEFPSVVNALECAVAIQTAMTERNARVEPARRMQFRIGINIGDVIYDDERIYGDGVNIAARLEGIADPGSIYVSRQVYEQVEGKLAVSFRSLGTRTLKNIAKPVDVFAVEGPTEPSEPPGRDAGTRQVPEAAETMVLPEARASIAVLPLRKDRVDQDQDYFADGVVDGTIHALSSLKDLFVISRGSALAYARDQADPVSIGRALGVRYVMGGGIWRHDGRLRITTELTDTESGTVVSSDHYDGAASELFELQDRISLKLIQMIAPQIREREVRRALRKQPQNMTAYDLHLQALDLLYRMDGCSFTRAGALLQRAMALDPTFAPSYTYAALWHVFRVGEFGSADPDADARAAADCAAAAIDRDGNDALALAIYGHVQAFLLRDFATALRFLDRALESGPSVAMAWTMSSATRGYIGNGPLAVQHGERGQRLAPADPYNFWHEGILAQAHYVNGDYDQAVSWARSAVSRNRAIRFTLRTLAAGSVARGQLEEARKAAAQLLQLHPDFHLGSYVLRCPFVQPILDQWIGHLRAAGLPD